MPCFFIDFDKENQMILVFCKLVEDDIVSQINHLYQNRQQDKKIFNGVQIN